MPETETYATLVVSYEATREHRSKLMECHGGYAVGNLDKDNPGTFLKVEVYIDKRAYVVLHAKDLIGNRREITFPSDNQIARKAYAFLTNHPDCTVVKAWEGVLAR